MRDIRKSSGLLGDIPRGTLVKRAFSHFGDMKVKDYRDTGYLNTQIPSEYSED